MPTHFLGCDAFTTLLVSVLGNKDMGPGAGLQTVFKLTHGVRKLRNAAAENRGDVIPKARPIVFSVVGRILDVGWYAVNSPELCEAFDVLEPWFDVVEVIIKGLTISADFVHVSVPLGN